MGKAYDVVVVGGGVVGLWIARHAIQAELSVALIDKSECGSGASGTVLGALLPHLPRVMSAKKQFQFEALAELGGLIAELEDETGRDAGYARCGRVMPIRTPRYLEHAKRACAGSVGGWRTTETGFAVSVRETSTVPGWIDPDTAPLGLIHDNLSARIVTERYTRALKSAVAKHATIIEGMEVTDFGERPGQVVSRCGTLNVSGKHVVLTAGHETFPLVERTLGLALGEGIKGQAATFDINTPHELPPVIYDNGVYIVPHGPGRCAVGSTSEDTFDDPTTPDPAKAESFIERAKELCPPLRDGKLVHHWAGVRPRCAAKDPIVGTIDPTRNIHIATGGYKITLGIAHRLARRMVEEIIGERILTEVPETYPATRHLQEVEQRNAARN